MLRISVATADGSADGGKDLQAQIDYFEKKQEKLLGYHQGTTRGGECAELRWTGACGTA
jgi:hypothetical protein